MKKFLTLILMFATALTALSGCASDMDQTYSIPSYDTETRIPTSSSSIGNSDFESDTNIETEGIFSVKEKKYSFQGNDLIVLDITNETKINYSVSITGIYYDASGTVLKKETKKFEQFASGYQNCFVFRPEFMFHNFKYELSFEEYSGELYTPKVSVQFCGTTETKDIIYSEALTGDFTRYPSLSAKFTYENKCDIALDAQFTFLLYNSKDEIVDWYDYTLQIMPHTSFGEDYKSRTLFQTKSDTLSLPENLQGELRALVLVNRVNPS
jgi:hypothetical protein